MQAFLHCAPKHGIHLSQLPMKFRKQQQQQQQQQRSP
jgi:hypothetical protein